MSHETPARATRESVLLRGVRQRMGREMSHEFTSDQIRTGIFDALHEGLTDTVESLLRVYAAWYPDDARALLDAVELAQRINAS